LIKVTIWNEFRHEKINDEVKSVYPDGIHGAIAAFLAKQGDIKITTATLDEPEHGLTDEVLKNTDVLIWWGHMAHEDVDDAIADKVHKKVVEDGMGFIALHSAHGSKVFRRFSGAASGKLSWREDEGLERIFFVEPSHPLAQGMPELVGISWFEGGEVMRSVFTYKRGMGKVVYLRPGHETLPIYYNENVQKLIINAVRYAKAGCIPAVSFRSNIELPKK
jgi:trehalose utilization protein